MNLLGIIGRRFIRRKFIVRIIIRIIGRRFGIILDARWCPATVDGKIKIGSSKIYRKYLLREETQTLSTLLAL